MELTGRLTADAQIVETAKKNKLVRFTVASNHRYKSQGGEMTDIVTYFNCAYWLNTNIAQFLLKGGLVEVSGRVSASAFKDKQGEPRASLEFHVDRIKLHGGNKIAASDKPSTTHTEPAPAAAPEDMPF